MSKEDLKKELNDIIFGAYTPQEYLDLIDSRYKAFMQCDEDMSIPTAKELARDLSMFNQREEIKLLLKEILDKK